MYADIVSEVMSLRNESRVLILSSFFKNAPGQYGYGDKFLGIYVPEIRAVAKQYKDASLQDIEQLLHHEYHEIRLLGLLILVQKYRDEPLKIYDFYMSHLHGVNNWDLVDLTADKIVGKHLLDKPRDVLYKLSQSKNLWERRIAIVSTFAFIRNNDFEDTLKLSEMLMNDDHELLHKACGWMLREVGKRDEKLLLKFLESNASKMPSIMRSYATERLSAEQKLRFKKKK